MHDRCAVRRQGVACKGGGRSWHRPAGPVDHPGFDRDTACLYIGQHAGDIATLALATMVSARASASSMARRHSFSLVISDYIYQNALSTFVGAFFFSIVAQFALKNGIAQCRALRFVHHHRADACHGGHFVRRPGR
jgi:hypothetical protein